MTVGVGTAETAKSVKRSHTVTLQQVTQAFGEHNVLDGVDLNVAQGEFVVLLGASGSGKSTLLRIISQLDQPRSGQVHVIGSIGYAFQEARLLPWNRVRSNVLFGLPTGGNKDERIKAAEAALEEVQLSHRAHAWPSTLSGGEAQRASLARALVREPDVLLLDEPFGALDALTRITMQELVLNLWLRHGFSVVMVTHDVTEAVRLADRIVLLENGTLAAEHVVDVERPRSSDNPDLIALEERLLDRLGVSRH